MFKWLARRSEDKRLRDLKQTYMRLLEEARDLQRGGDIKGFAAKTAEAEQAGKRLEQAEAAARASN